MATKKPPKSPFKRSLSLFGAAAKIASKEVSSKIKNSLKEKIDEKAPEHIKMRIAQAQILTENLGQLKGAAMKVGQLLSTEAEDFLPKEALDILGKLQSDAPKVEFEVMYEQIISDIGEDKFNQLLDFNRNPIAAASIGQVYEAKLADGRAVVLKVQYPGVADSMESDIRILKKIVEPMLKISGRSMKLDDLFDEISDTLVLEADYENEKKATIRYGNNLENIPGYIVPEIIPEFCGKKVLCATKVNGISIGEWIRLDKSYEQKEDLARLVLDLFMIEFFDFGFVQTDPNFGNFFVQEDPLNLVLLDFGATKEYSDSFINFYKDLLRTFGSRDKSLIFKTAYEQGFLDPRESDQAKDYFYKMLETSFEPFFKDKQPFKFNDEDYSKRSKEVVKEFVASLKYTSPKREIIFLHRKLGGIFNLLKNLQVELNLDEYWEKMTS